MQGHEAGVRRVEEIVKAARERGIEYLTLYAFSKENWNRPKEEVNFLMGLLASYIDKKIDAIIKEGCVFNVIGEISDLAEPIQKKLYAAMEKSKVNKGLTVSFAISYSSRREILRAARNLAQAAVDGKMKPESISEEVFSQSLYTHDIPDPELLIRTSGEMRISNFLLWQISYSELYITDKCWPDFTAEELDKALENFKTRERRFGNTTAQQRGTK